MSDSGGRAPGIGAAPRFGAPPSRAEARTRPRRWQRRYRLYRILFFGALAPILVLAGIVNAQEEARKREEGTFLRADQITRSDHPFSDGTGRFDGWVLELLAGQTLRASLQTSDLVPYFYVTGPLEAPSPAMLAESRETFDGAMVEFTPDERGEYALIIPSFDAAYGSYELTTNYRVRAIDSTGTEMEGAAAGLMLAVILLWFAHYLGLFAFLEWTYPDRILLLRPFGQRRVSKALKRFNRRTLAYRGFTLTLADKYLKNSLSAYLLANIPLDMGSLLVALYRPLFRRMHRWVFIRRSRDLRILRLRLRSRWTLTRFWQSWLGLGDRINKFRSRDELWKDCIGILLDDCQVIVVDLSDAGAGTLWELEELFRRDYGYKSIFLVCHDDEEVLAAQAVLERVIAAERVGAPGMPMLHRYTSDDGRLLEPDAFDSAYAAAVSSPLQPRPTQLPLSRKAVIAVAPIFMAPLWAPVGLPLAILALRDIRRANGLLRGEVLAHFSVVIYGMILCVYVAIAAAAIYLG